ncbi:MAG TPA: DUF4340 domain-containing protein [Polyangia bacterium]|nr:DUF4340 domain-containing protein [Polyangia bacterium]
MSRRTIGAAAIFLVAAGAGAALYRVSAWRRAPAVASRPSTDELPALAVSKEDAAAITRIQLHVPAGGDGGAGQTVVLERVDTDWQMTAPVRGRASADKVRALIQNLQTLHAWKMVDRTARNDDAYDLTEAKALHIAAWTPTRQVIDLYCGKSSMLGQLARTGAAEGTLALINWGNDGYAGFLYTRDPRSWRETAIFRFDPAAAARIEIANRHGLFVLDRHGDRWGGTVARRSGGRLGAPRAWDDADAAKVAEMLGAYASLAADDFGDDADKATAGIDEADQTGGVVRIQLRGAPSELVLRVGKLSNRNTRFAIKDSRWAMTAGDDTLYSLSPWTARWALADTDAFKPADRAAAGDRAPPAATPRPPGRPVSVR